MNIMEFYRGKKVLITGHTGFKGSWMTKLLLMAGCVVTGYALEPTEDTCLFKLLGLDKKCDNLRNIYGDIRDFDSLLKVFEESKPEIVIHMAAQPIVRESYKNPRYTYDTNVMGTVNVLECIRLTESVKSFVNVTTDKVYKNFERKEGYSEEEELNGYDPYSNSKSCSELVTDSYRKAFFADDKVAITTMRAGNVIGGGDFAADRIIPDCVRATLKGEDIIVRNPNSIRPYQHVLEPVVMYLHVAAMQYADISYQGAYNVGPDDEDAITTGEMATLFVNTWNNKNPGGLHEAKWVNVSDNGPHEATFLKLNCNRLKKTFSWKPKWHVDKTMDLIIEWYQTYALSGDINEVVERQIKEITKE